MPADNWEPWWRWELPTRAGEHDVSAAAFPQSSDQSQQRVGLAGAAAADFNLPARPARKGRNPQTGEAIQIAASKAVQSSSGAS